jgi:hypothetical protein
VCLAAFATGLSVMNNINAQRRWKELPYHMASFIWLSS